MRCKAWAVVDSNKHHGIIVDSAATGSLLPALALGRRLRCGAGRGAWLVLVSTIKTLSTVQPQGAFLLHWSCKGGSGAVLGVVNLLSMK